MSDVPPPPPVHAQRLARPWLLADIGGTNARFGILADGQERPSQVHSLPAADFDGPAAAVRHYLAGLAALQGSAYRAPRAAAFAVATAVVGDTVAFTNSGWSFSRQATRAELGLDELLILNDFAALALSLPHLKPEQVQAVGAHRPLTPAAPPAVLAVVGPGTGLGVAGIVPTAHGWVALPGEGGHATLAPADDYECALLAAVRRDRLQQGGSSHVSAERLLSGIGLPVLHAAVLAVDGRTGPAMTAAEIVQRGLSGEDEACSRCLDVFCALLGGFAGNVALTLGARGGLFIGGGIVPRLGDRFLQSAFRARFEAKGRFEPYLKAIPSALITDTLVALTGAAQALEQHGA